MSQNHRRHSPPAELGSASCQAIDDVEYSPLQSVRIDDVRPTTSEERLRGEEAPMQEDVGRPAVEVETLSTSHHIPLSSAQLQQQRSQFVDQLELPSLFQAFSLDYYGNMTSHCPSNSSPSDEELFKRPVGVPPKSQAQVRRRSEARVAPLQSSPESQDADVRQQTTSCHLPASNTRDLTTNSTGCPCDKVRYSLASSEEKVPSRLAGVAQEDSNVGPSPCRRIDIADEDGLVISTFTCNAEDERSSADSGVSSQGDKEDEEEEEEEHERDCESDDIDDKEEDVYVDCADDEADRSEVEKKDGEDSSDEEELGFFRDPPVCSAPLSPEQGNCCRSPTATCWQGKVRDGWTFQRQRASQNTTAEDFAIKPSRFHVPEDEEVHFKSREDEEQETQNTDGVDKTKAAVGCSCTTNDSSRPSKRRRRTAGRPCKRRKRRVSARRPKYQTASKTPDSGNSSDDEEEETELETPNFSKPNKNAFSRLGKRRLPIDSDEDMCPCGSACENNGYPTELKRKRKARRGDSGGRAKARAKSRGRHQVRNQNGNITQRKARARQSQLASYEGKRGDINCRCAEELRAARKPAHRPLKHHRRRRRRNRREYKGGRDHTVEVSVVRGRRAPRASPGKRCPATTGARAGRGEAAGGREASTHGAGSRKRRGRPPARGGGGGGGRLAWDASRTHAPRTAPALQEPHHVTLDRLEEVCLEQGLHQFFDLRTFIRRIWNRRRHAYQDMQVSSQTVDLLNGCLALVFQQVAKRAGIIARRFNQSTLDWFFVQDAIDELLPHSNQYAAVMQYEGRRCVNQHRLKVARRRCQKKKSP